MTGIELIMTCSVCPEQYDAFKGGVQVGYLRLRHGRFYAACPDVGGEEVYEAFPNGDGEFDDNERDHFLSEAKAAIEAWISAKVETV